MRIAILIYLLLIPFISLSNTNRLFNSLKNLYQTDKKLCYELAKYKIKKGSKDYSPYFFAIKCKLYQDSARDIRFTNDEERIETYLKDILQMISYAKKVNHYMNEDMMYLHNWFWIWDELNERIISVVSNMSHHDIKRAERLADLAKSVIYIEIRDSGYIAYSQDKRITNSYPNIKAKDFLNGIPNGDENIPSSNMQEEIEFIKLLNKERVNKGMKPLKLNQDLTRAARYHSYDMGSQNYFSHKSQDRLNNGSRLIEACGTFVRIRKFSKHYGGENIFAGGSSAQSAYINWYNSPGHYKIMFNPEYTEIGIGFVAVEGSTYRNYWTADFK